MAEISHTETHELTVGDRVSIVLPADAAIYRTKWFPREGATGTITKVFKNGQALVAVDQVRNRSEDGLWTGQFPLSALCAR